MKNILKKLATAGLLIAVILGVAAVNTNSLYAQNQGSVQSGTGTSTASGNTNLSNQKASACDGAIAAGVTSCNNPDEAKAGFRNIIGTIINILSVVVGAVSVIMIIIGGFRYVVSNGDSNGISGAKNTILYAVVGLVIVLFAQIIVGFVIDRATI